MADIDLRKLSAPFETLRPALEDAYKRLDAKWEAITETLKTLPIPTDVSYTYEFDEGDAWCLAWKKHNGKKRVCMEYHVFNPYAESDSEWEVRTTPYEEWSGQQRIDMLEHVPGLFEAAATATQEFIDRIKV